MNYKELNNAQKKINNWYSKKTKVLNIKTRPFNTKAIFSNIIHKVLSENGKILYVLCDSKTVEINKKEKDIIYYFIKEDDKTYNKNNIQVININMIKSVVEEFELVIVDDITNFSDVNINKIRDAVEEIYWRSKKIIIYSCEKAFPIGEKFELVYLKSNSPVIEPRLITTRIKLEEDIPLVLYEYLKWFKENKKVTLIFTPNEEKLNKVYNHYYNTLKAEDIRVVKYSKDQSFKFINEIIEHNDDALFVLTSNIGDYIKTIENLNIIILFSDDAYFTYKKIVYLCSVLKKKDNTLPESILVAKEISTNMEKAKSITRGYNQKLWEKKLLKV